MLQVSKYNVTIMPVIHRSLACSYGDYTIVERGHYCLIATKQAWRPHLDQVGQAGATDFLPFVSVKTTHSARQNPRLPTGR
jgi:hypothetical protein